MSVADDINVLKLSDPLTMMQSIRNDQIDTAMWTTGSLGGVLADKSAIRFVSIPRKDVVGLEDLPSVSVFVQTVRRFACGFAQRCTERGHARCHGSPPNGMGVEEAMRCTRTEAHHKPAHPVPT